jgi:hypothetical protein
MVPDPNFVGLWIERSNLCTLVDRKVSNQMRRIELPITATSRQGAACGAQKAPYCIAPLRLQIKFLKLSGSEKQALHEAKAKNTTLYETSLPRFWRCLPPIVIAATKIGPGLVLTKFNFNFFTTAINFF